jgi:hypothetical protein
VNAEPAPEKVLMDQVLKFRETGMSMAEAWRKVLALPRKTGEPYAVTRAKALAAGKLSAQQEAVAQFGDGRSFPGTTIQSIRPTPGVPATTPPAERKPGESAEAFRKRLRQQVLDLGKPANSVTAAQAGHGQAVPQGSDPSPSNDDFAEVGGAEFHRRKQLLLASEPAKNQEIARRLSAKASDTTALRDKAMAWAKARGVTYKVALSEVGKEWTR